MNFPKTTAELIERVSALPFVNVEPRIEFVEPTVQQAEPYWRTLLQWTPSGGSPIMLKDLTDDHLRNLIFFFNREYGYNYALTPGSSSGGMLNRNEVMPSRRDIYLYMRKEADYRKLSWS